MARERDSAAKQLSHKISCVTAAIGDTAQKIAPSKPTLSLKHRVPIFMTTTAVIADRRQFKIRSTIAAA
jgi:hypothetical protein